MLEGAVQELRRLPSEELARVRSEVRVLVISGLGLNCEVETATAFRMVGADAEMVHLLDLLDGRSGYRLADYR
ncbi:MAG: phosphoribosylformylglycinamidine synthase subunit PurQ, partial [Thermoanaerobaculia bacterium]